MKKILIIIITILILALAFYFITKKSTVEPEVVVPAPQTEQTDQTLRDNVENYLRANISQLSPVKPVLGGTWYVVSVTSDLATNSGVVVYEDGHIQETRNFTFTANEKQEVVSLTILE